MCCVFLKVFALSAHSLPFPTILQFAIALRLHRDYSLTDVDVDTIHKLFMRSLYGCVTTEVIVAVAIRWQNRGTFRFRFAYTQFGLVWFGLFVCVGLCPSELR